MLLERSPEPFISLLKQLVTMFGFVGIIVGILLLIAGVFLVFFFPTTEEHQPVSFGVTGIVIGIVFLIIGFVLVFL